MNKIELQKKSRGKDKNKIALFSALVIIAAIAAWTAMRVSDNRADAAKAAAARAESLAEQARAEEEAQIRAEKAAERQAAANETALKKSEADRKTALANAEAEKAAAARAASEAEKAAADRDAKRAAAAQAASDAEAEQARAATARAEAEKAKTLAKAQEKETEAKLEMERLAAEQKKAVTARVEAEAKVLELKRLNLEEIEMSLAELKKDLDEREAALRPEKTILDLETTHGDEGTNVTGKAEGALLAENDRTLPRQTRALAKARRIEEEFRTEAIASAKSNAISRLERLYIQSLKNDRITDAEFYRTELERMYPDWKYEPSKEKEEEKK